MNRRELLIAAGLSPVALGTGGNIAAAVAIILSRFHKITA
jgi:hypothetical protein